MHEWDFKPITIDNFHTASKYLMAERVSEYGVTPICLYAPLDGAEAADLQEGFLCRYQEDGVTCYTTAYPNPHPEKTVASFEYISESEATVDVYEVKYT